MNFLLRQPVMLARQAEIGQKQPFNQRHKQQDYRYEDEVKMIDKLNVSGWTVSELLAFFDRKSVPRDAYAIYADADESYCLVQEGNEWLVYYSERGSRNHLGWGKTEAQALNILKLFVLEGCRKL